VSSRPSTPTRLWFDLALPFLLVFAALAWMRHEMATHMEIGWAQAFAIGAGRGLLQDAAVAALPSVAAGLAAALLRVPPLLVWAPLALAACACSYANLLYVEYFGVSLRLWVIEQHLADTWVIRELVGSMLLGVVAPAVLASLAALALLVWVGTRTSRGAAATSTALAALFGVAAGSSALYLEPAYQLGGSALSENVFFAIWKRDYRPQRNLAETEFTTAEIEAEHRRTLEVAMAEGKSASPVGVDLASFRDWDLAIEVPERESRARSWPMLRQLRADPEATRALRRQLGLPEDRAPDIVMLFLETVRAFEVQHPEIGEAIFPEYHRVVSEHGIAFSHAYSSALAVGLTVRGRFSSLCSMLPNFNAAATYISNPGLRVRCLPELAAEQGYDTLWLSGGPKHFHNKFVFESIHGFRAFYDEPWFMQFPFEAPFEGCGFPDKPFLRRSADLLAEREGPFLASLLTLSTHPPYSRVREAPVPNGVMATLREQKFWPEPYTRIPYVGYLSRLRYLDQSLGEFVDRLFAAENGERTLVVVLGDHAAGIRTVFDTTPEQKVEIRARIPMALLTKHMPEPQRIDAPVHQLDLAPTLAAIAGLEGEVTWIGRSLFGPGGSPWLFSGPGELHWRVGPRACYTAPGESQPRCYRIAAGGDPLFDRDIERVPLAKTQRHYMIELADDTRRAISENRIAPTRAN
jgi:hypothetical protein